MSIVLGWQQSMVPGKIMLISPPPPINFEKDIDRYKQLCLYINLHIKDQHVLLLRNDYLYVIYTFQIKLSLI